MAPAPKFKKKTLVIIFAALVVLAATVLALLLASSKVRSPTPEKITVTPSIKTPTEIEDLAQKAKESKGRLETQEDGRKYASNPVILDIEIKENLVNLVLGVSEGIDKIIYGLIKPGKGGLTTASFKKKSGGFAAEKELKPEAAWYQENIIPGQTLHGVLFLPASPFEEGEIKLPKNDQVEILYPQRLIFLIGDE